MKISCRTIRLLGFAAIVLLPCRAQEKSPSGVTVDEVLQILSSNNELTLSKAFSKSQKLYEDRVARAFQEYRLNNSDSGLFEVLPASSAQIQQLYDLTTLNPPKGKAELKALYEGYFQTVFKRAPRHPESFPVLISIAANYGGKLSEGEQEWFCDLLHGLYMSAPDLYLQSLVAVRGKERHMGLVCAAACTDTK